MPAALKRYKRRGRPPKRRIAVEAAVIYVIRNRHATFRSVANMYCIPFQALRGTINNRYGSLAAARVFGQIAKSPRMVKTWTRPCMTCGARDERIYGQYRCDKCKADAEKYHEGVV